MWMSPLFVYLVAGRLSMPTLDSDEDIFGQEGRNDPVGRVHDLTDLEVGGDRAEDVSLLARESALGDQVLDHIARGLLGRGEEIGAVSRCGEVRARAHARGQRPARAQLRLGQPPRALEPEAQCDTR